MIFKEPNLIMLTKKTTFKTVNSSIYAINKNYNKDLNITCLEKNKYPTFFLIDSHLSLTFKFLNSNIDTP